MDAMSDSAMTDNIITSQNERMQVLALAQQIADEGGIYTVALDIGAVSTITDYFVITSARSVTHLHGLVRRIRDLLVELEIEPAKSQKRHDDSGWVLFDCGFAVIHVMLADLRAFYELERLWLDGQVVFPAQDATKRS